MSSQYSTIKQHEPLRAPAGWSPQEKRFVAQLEEILDDLYSRFGRLREEDMGKPLRASIVKSASGVSELKQTAEGLETSVSNLSGDVSELTQTVSGFETAVKGYEGQVSEFSQTVSGFETAVKGYEGQVSEFSQTVSGFETSVSGLSGDLTEIEGRVKSAESTISQQAAAISQKVSVETYDSGMSQKADRTEIPDVSGLASKSDIPDVSTKVESSEFTQKANEISAIFKSIGLGGGQTGITGIGPNGLTVTHSSIGGKTSMNADGFRIFDASGNVIGGLINLNGSVMSAVQRLANTKSTTFYVEVAPNIYGDGENGLEFIIEGVKCGAITAQYLDGGVVGMHIRSENGISFSTPNRTVGLGQIYANGVNVHFSTTDPGGNNGDIWLKPVGISD